MAIFKTFTLAKQTHFSPKLRCMKHYMFLVIALLLLTTGPACRKDKLWNCDEHEAAPCDPAPGKINIRVKNVSKYNYCNVFIDPYNKATNYGVVREDDVTCYRSFDVAYRYAYVSLSVKGEEWVLTPIDYVGETPLDPGNYTYSIDVKLGKNKTMTMTATRD